MGAGYVHVRRGLFLASAEETRLRDDEDAREPLLSDAEPALHRSVAVPGSQRPVVVGRCPEVPSVDVGRGLGRAQGRVSPLRQRVIDLCPLSDRAERLHYGGPRVKVAVMTGDVELGVAWARRRVLQDGVLRRPPVLLVQHSVAVE